MISPAIKKAGSIDKQDFARRGREKQKSKRTAWNGSPVNMWGFFSTWWLRFFVFGAVVRRRPGQFCFGQFFDCQDYGIIMAKISKEECSWRRRSRTTVSSGNSPN